MLVLLGVAVTIYEGQCGRPWMPHLGVGFYGQGHGRSGGDSGMLLAGVRRVVWGQVKVSSGQALSRDRGSEGK
jgi:hypothetical protein